MMLLTKELKEKLLKNGKERPASDVTVPVVKFFYPAGAGTWLFTELDPEDQDTLYGLCDPGHGTPELGSTSLSEFTSFRGRFGLGIERDRHWMPKWSLREYAEKAFAYQRIMD